MLLFIGKLVTWFSFDDTSFSWVTSAVSLGLDDRGLLVLSNSWFFGSGWIVAFAVGSCFDVRVSVVVPVVSFSLVGISVVICWISKSLLVMFIYSFILYMFNRSNENISCFIKSYEE